MPKLDIIEQKGKVTSPPFLITKDGKDFAFAPNIMAARAIKVALEDWWLRNPRPDNV
jgi:hypothetical protein